MYLSRLTLRMTAPGVRQSLHNCQDMHRTLLRSFDCSREEAGLLYRVIRTNENLFIYVQSLARPQWERIETNGYICEKIQDISAVLERFQENSLLRFSLLTCPAKKVKCDGRNSKRVLLRGMEERLDWLKRQGEKNGFSVQEAHETAKEQHVYGIKSSGEFYLAGVPFEGVLQITDPAAFRLAFQRGIGAEKAYGFGLLMVSRV